MRSSMTDERFLEYARLLLRYQAQNGPFSRVYDDGVLRVEETQDGIKVTNIPHLHVILNWKRTGLFYDTHPRVAEDENHLEKLVVLYAMAKDL